MNQTGVMTIGDLCRHFDRPYWMMRKLFTRGFLAETLRVGPYRVVPVTDLPQVEAALRAAGYLPSDTANRGANVNTGVVASDANGLFPVGASRDPPVIPRHDAARAA
jgi:hypothetical protein